MHRLSYQRSNVSIASRERWKAVAVAIVADRSIDRLLPRLAEPTTIPLWIVDLTLDFEDLAAVGEAIRTASPTAKIIAYGPHVHVGKLEAAAAAGFVVLTRGQFDHQMSDIVGSVAAAN